MGSTYNSLRIKTIFGRCLVNNTMRYISLFCVFMFYTPVTFAEDAPLEFNRSFGEYVGLNNHASEKPYVASMLKRFFHEPTSEMLSHMKGLIQSKLKLEKGTQNFFYAIDAKTQGRGYYLSVENTITGFTLLDLLDITSYKADSVMISIEGMPHSVPQFLSGLDFSGKQGLTLKYYTKTHSDSTELYVVAEFDSEIFGASSFLLLDSFYPNTYRNHFEREIKEGLVKFVNDAF